MKKLCVCLVLIMIDLIDCRVCPRGQFLTSDTSILTIKRTLCSVFIEGAYVVADFQFRNKKVYVKQSGVTVYIYHDGQNWCVASSIGSTSPFAFSQSYDMSVPTTGWTERCENWWKRPTYWDVQAELVCKVCPFNSNSIEGSHDIAQCLCNPGTYGQVGEACSLCASGKFSSTIGARTVRTCIACAMGSYSASSGATTCLLCADINPTQAVSFPYSGCEMTLPVTTEIVSTTSTMPVPMTTPTTGITVVLYDILFSFRMSGNVDIQTKYSIRNETALYLNTDMEMVGLLQTENYLDSASIQASFMVSSFSKDASRQVESSLTLETINRVLRRATNGTITAINLVVSRKYAEVESGNKNTIVGDLMGSLAGVFGFIFLVTVIYIIVNRKKVEKSPKTLAASSDVSNNRYSSVCLHVEL